MWVDMHTIPLQYYTLNLAQAQRLLSHTDFFERRRNQGFLLVHRTDDPTADPEEVILNVQGYLVDCSLPPIKQDQ